MMRKNRVTSACIVVAAICSTGALAGFKDANLDQRFTSKSTVHGVIFQRLSDGKILFEKNADTQVSPASVTKIITGAAALSYFLPPFKIKTPIYYSGNFKNGRISGSLFIKGQGDPFLVSEVLWQAATDLKQMGIKSIEQGIVIDNSAFDSESHDDSRKDGLKRSTHAYDAPVSSFAVNFSTITIAVTPSTKGQNAVIGVTPFPLKNVRLSGTVKTVAGAQSDGVSVSRSSTSTGGVEIKVSGSIGESAPQKKIYRSVANPFVASADYVRGFLENAGIKITGKIQEGATPTNAKLLYEIEGYEMRKIVGGLNTFSNNFIADMLTKLMGTTSSAAGQQELFGRKGSLSSGAEFISSFLKSQVGISTPFTLINGSGLSTENRFTARQFIQVLSWMEKQAELFPDFLGSLPASGWDGTLKKRIKNNSDLAGVVRAKTGTLTDPITVAGVAGYFRHPEEGWVAFVMIGNGVEGRGQPGLMDVRNTQDDAIKAIFK
ncbi:MAG: D-alanyl-D-alanine carboxypeptidase/D-alanyl-D-alanine-endopeptidase [Proteobacteria bacterium]|nr:D-alanyl-D-alanine carboxypeptidase/D-alanyl-D-alanine-endopeptidase [Pseudomonadota bacterium]